MAMLVPCFSDWSFILGPVNNVVVDDGWEDKNNSWCLAAAMVEAISGKGFSRLSSGLVMSGLSFISKA